MNCIHQHTVRLLARNEGKIKSYESCSDVRAWSHDMRAKDRHLREWIKSDMPVCIPVSTLTGCLRAMTCGSRRVAPRCQLGCKSKVLLDSICTSCHAMRESLKNDDSFEKYFVEEELETSQWPCERCLEALKSIKMFWKIIVDKIFNISLAKYENFDTDCSSGDNVKSVANIWQNEMVQQALYVKKIKPEVKLHLFESVISKKDTKQISSHPVINSSPIEDRSQSKHTGKVKHHHSSKSDDNTTKRINYTKRSDHNKLNKNAQTSVKMVDAGCDACFLEQNSEEIKAHKKNLQILQDNYNTHLKELEKLKNENNSLRIELQNVYKSCPWKSEFYCPDGHSTNHVVKPFQINLDECPSPVKNVDSEMIITMKKCKHEDFRHVSLLQVLHKTNDPIHVDSNNGTSCKKEDPIDILTRVQNTFGAIVKREMSIAKDRRCRPKRSDIEATFHKVNSSKSAPSCSTLSSKYSSEMNFILEKDTKNRPNSKIINV